MREAAARLAEIIWHEGMHPLVLSLVPYPLLLGTLLLAGAGVAPAITAILPPLPAGILLVALAVGKFLALLSGKRLPLLIVLAVAGAFWTIVLCSIFVLGGPLGGVAIYTSLVLSHLWICLRLALEP